ncbi:GGDEF domain-containing protein [Runella sp. MFBS21]|uniref:GGDEF domain-containing protein n=1 Tax=Runella sp. MFBS21 TaxID=3034018 RepID=UPI0023F863FB|nr:GGDEF domain-containing protein [Runella sp. MFBS21]MDF7822338.1 GGDEF domain-containing protein [Runella sp. MFBS21]
MEFLYFCLGFFLCLIISIVFYFAYLKPKIESLKYIDSQIGLFNYKYFLKALSQINCKSILMIIDIDDFKKYNSKYSYDIGDKVIIKVKDIIVSVVKEYDGQTFRYRNGDEFIVLLSKINADHEILRHIINLIKINVSDINIREVSTLSFGITFIDGKSDVSKSILRLESALLTAKTVKNSAYCLSEDFEDWIFNNPINNGI